MSEKTKKEDLKFFCEINFAVINYKKTGKGKTPFYNHKMTKNFRMFLHEYDPNLEIEANRREKK